MAQILPVLSETLQSVSSSQGVRLEQTALAPQNPLLGVSSVEEKQKQLLLSLQFVKPPQTCALHCEDVHEPFSHVPDGHTFPHEPQLFGSVRVFVQAGAAEENIEDGVDKVLDGAADEDEL